MRSIDAAERKEAVQALLEESGISVGVQESIDAFVQALSDVDPDVRAAAAQSLAAVIYRVQRISATVPVVANQQNLKRWSDDAARRLVSLLHDQVPAVRVAAANGLGVLVRRRARRFPNALWLFDVPMVVQRQDAKTERDSLTIALPPELIAALQDQAVKVRAAAASALANFGVDQDDVIQVLLGMMEQDDATVRRACADALNAAWPTPLSVAPLQPYLKSHDREVRYYAASLLGRIGPAARAAIPDLITVLKEPVGETHPNPARGAARALGQMGPDPAAIAALVEEISPANVEPYFVAMARVSSRNDGQPGADAHSDAAAAARAWSRVSDAAATARALSRVMDATSALGEIGPPAVAAVPAMIANYRRAMEARHSMAQGTIPIALARIAQGTSREPEVIAVLVSVLDSSEVGFHGAAINALGRFGAAAAPAIPKLRALAESSKSINRKAAADCLIMLDPQSRTDATKKIGGR